MKKLDDGFYFIVGFRDGITLSVLNNKIVAPSLSKKEQDISMGTPRWSFSDNKLTYHYWNNNKDVVEFDGIILGDVDGNYVIYDIKRDQYLDTDGIFKNKLDSGRKWIFSKWDSIPEFLFSGRYNDFVQDILTTGMSYSDGQVVTGLPSDRKYLIEIGDKCLTGTGELKSCVFDKNDENVSRYWRYNSLKGNISTPAFDESPDLDAPSAPELTLASSSVNSLNGLLNYKSQIINSTNCKNDDCNRFILFPTGIYDKVVGACINPLTGIVPCDNTGVNILKRPRQIENLQNTQNASKVYTYILIFGLIFIFGIFLMRRKRIR